MTFRRKAFFVVAAALVTFLAAALGFRAWFYKDPAPVDIHKVVDEFVNRTTVPTNNYNQELLPEGVYTYKTEGFESIKGKISNTNSYPELTPITIVWTRCGYDSRWQPMVSRWDVTSLCLQDNGLVETGSTEQHEFFHTKEQRTYVCDPPALLVPRLIVEGHSWTSSCTDGKGVDNRTMTIKEATEIQVGTELVKVVHIEVDQVLTGENTGSTKIDYWLDPINGQIVKYKKRISADSDSILGIVTYTEEVDLSLTSMFPIKQ